MGVAALGLRPFLHTPPCTYMYIGTPDRPSPSLIFPVCHEPPVQQGRRGASLYPSTRGSHPRCSQNPGWPGLHEMPKNPGIAEKPYRGFEKITRYSVIKCSQNYVRAVHCTAWRPPYHRRQACGRCPWRPGAPCGYGRIDTPTDRFRHTPVP